MTKTELKMARLYRLIERGQALVNKVNALKDTFVQLNQDFDAFAQEVKTDSENHKKSKH
jgi:hypothetical protein